MKSIEELRSDFTVAELALMWCQLNNLNWPRALGEKPRDWSYSDSAIPIVNTSGWMMKSIESIIGIKECLRAWNDEHMSREVFENWWKDNMEIRQ